MPTSDGWGKDRVKERFVNYALSQGTPDVVLDVGPGEGTYSRLMRDTLSEVARRRGESEPRWAAVEAWAPYVETYGLRALYDAVHVADASLVDLARIVPGDSYAVAVLGDVYEHLAALDGLELLRQLEEHGAFGHLLIACPVCDSPQGAVGGNWFEAHQRQFTPEAFMDELDGILGPNWHISYHIGDVVGYAAATYRGLVPLEIGD